MATKLRRQDLAALVGHFTGMGWAINRYARLKGLALARVLAFHDVAPGQEVGFLDKMRWLKATTSLVSLNDVLCGNLARDRLNVALTFDDGYKSWSSFVAPALANLGVPATFFVSSGLLDLQGRQEQEFIRQRLQISQATTGALSSDALRRISQSGFAVGGHTTNHRDLSAINDPEVVAGEIGQDKASLERITGSRVEYFAYPFGACERPMLDLAPFLQRAGYQGAVTLIPGTNVKPLNPFAILRDLADPGMPMASFKARILGGYDVVLAVRRRLGLSYDASAWDLAQLVRRKRRLKVENDA